MYVDGIPSYMIKAVNGLSFTDSEVIIDHINTYIKVRAKRRYNDLVLSLYDPVTPSGAQAVTAWTNTQYQRPTGVAGYATDYWKDISMVVIGPPGDIVREWICKKQYVKEASFGEYDWSTEVYTTMQLTLGGSGFDLSF